MNSCLKIILQIESQRDGYIIAQGATLGSSDSNVQALKGRNRLTIISNLSRPFRAVFISPTLPRVTPWAIPSRSVGA